MGYPPLPLPRELPNGSQKNQPWITRIDPSRGQLKLTLSCATASDKSVMTRENGPLTGVRVRR